MEKIYIIETEQVTYYKNTSENLTWRSVLPKFYTTKEAAESEIKRLMDDVERNTREECKRARNRIYVGNRSFAYRITELNAAE